MIRVDSLLVNKLKPFQADGVIFLWTALFETLYQLESDIGNGCILEQSSGLGKTLQVISLIHTVLKHTDLTHIKRVLILCPFEQWLKYVEPETVVKLYYLRKRQSLFDKINVINS